MPQVPPYRPLPLVPAKQVKVYVCSFCLTRINYFSYVVDGCKPCYNCGSTTGEIK